MTLVGQRNKLETETAKSEGEKKQNEVKTPKKKVRNEVLCVKSRNNLLRKKKHSKIWKKGFSDGHQIVSKELIIQNGVVPRTGTTS